MSGWYLDGKEQLLARTIPSSAGVYVTGVNDEYVFNASHTLFADFEANVILSEQELAGVTYTDGTLDGNDMTWLEAGLDIVDRSLMLQGVIIYFKQLEVGTLLAFIDSAAAGLPQLLTGVNVTAKWNAQGILKL